ncbi:MAG: DUF4424 family protein [Alphaproteobacteria bacterium]
MMRRTLCPAALAAALLAAAPAAANDSTAVLGAGGLELVHTDAVAMESEHLAISRSEVVVRYRFRNLAGRPIRSVVAFPLPEIDLSQLAETPITQPNPDPDDFVGFRVAVDGRPVAAKVEMRAWRHGVDVTDLLAALGLPVSRFHPELYPRLLAQPAHVRRALRAPEIAAWEDHDNVYPLWTMRAAFHWEQEFPADRPLAVEHRYRPVVGESSFGQYLLADTDEARQWRADFCVDERARAALAARLALARPDDPYRPMRTIAYVLTTARNWAGPIGLFHLALDKGPADSVMVTCAAGLAGPGPVWEVRDFVPARELTVAIVD